MSVSIINDKGRKLYRARRTNPVTKVREETRCTTKREAEKVDREMAERFQELKRDAKGRTADIPKYTVRETNLFRTVAQDYIDQSHTGRDGKRALELNTLASYQSYLDRFFEEAFGDVCVEDMTRQDVRTAVSRIRSLSPSTDTAQRVYRFAKSVMKWAVESLELRDASPMAGLDIESDKVDRSRLPKTHTNEEIDRMIAVAYAKYTSTNGTTRKAWVEYYPLFMVLATTGMRSSECFAMTWDCLSDSMRVAHIDKRIIRYVAGVTKDNRVGQPKSSHSYRDVPIPEQVAILLRERKKVATTPWVFPDRAGGPKSYRTVRERMWKVLIEEAKVRPLGMHALRHYAASLVIKERGALVVREIMGHHSTAFTLKTYGGFIEDKAKVIQEVGDMFDARVTRALSNLPEQATGKDK